MNEYTYYYDDEIEVLIQFKNGRETVRMYIPRFQSGILEPLLLRYTQHIATKENT